METNCSNCRQAITGNFCSNCGQKKYKRIDKKYIWDEVQYTLLHTNKGFLYSVKNILKNPGKTAREFIDGNRVNHYKPILLAFVLSTISAFISYKIIGFNTIMKDIYTQKGMYSDLMNDMLSFSSSYNSFIMLFCIPFFALMTKIAFRKWGHNYYEHLVMNAYVLAFYTLVNIILLYPLIYFMKNNLEIFEMFSVVAMMTVPFILVWFYKGFYPEKSLISIILRVLLILFMMFILFILLIIAGTIAYLVMYGAEAAQRAQYNSIQ